MRSIILLRLINTAQFSLPLYRKFALTPHLHRPEILRHVAALIPLGGVYVRGICGYRYHVLVGHIFYHVLNPHPHRYKIESQIRSVGVMMYYDPNHAQPMGDVVRVGLDVIQSAR